MSASPKISRVALALSLCFGLSHCATSPPYVPPSQPGTISLDSAPPSGRKSRQPTRYLENTGERMEPGMASSELQGPPLRYDTPESLSTPPSQEPVSPTPPQPQESTVTTTPPPTTSSSTTAQPDQMPFGVPVPGKKGFVYSPFDREQMVDVRGIAPGKKVRCPYTSKIFLVP